MEAQKSPKPESAGTTTEDTLKERESDVRGRKEDERGSVGHNESTRAPEKTAREKEEAKAGAAKDKAPAKTSRAGKSKNNVRKLRMERMMSKAELARRAGLSTLTVDRVERGMPCRMDTKRKILEAMGLRPSDRVMVFGDSPDEDDD